MNFRIQTDSSFEKDYVVVLKAVDKNNLYLDSLVLKACSGNVEFDIQAWKRCVSTAYVNNGNLLLQVYGRTRKDVQSIPSGSWIVFPSITWFVASDSIDSYLTYRLSAHDENPCKQLQVYQRCLEDFSGRVIMDNAITDNNCMNCHANSGNDANTMVVHIRGMHAGTLIMKDGRTLKIGLPPGYPDLRLAYPAWSSDGRFVAFASTRIRPYPFVNGHRTQDLIADTLGKILIYDVEKNEIFSSEQLCSSEFESTFPAWSPDGKILYFCRAPRLWSCSDSLSLKEALSDFRYDFVKVPFDPESRTLGPVELVYSFSSRGEECFHASD